MPKAKLLTPEEVCERLNITMRHFRGLLFREELPRVRVGGLVRVLESDIDAYIERQRQGVAS